MGCIVQVCGSRSDGQPRSNTNYLRRLRQVKETKKPFLVINQEICWQLKKQIVKNRRRDQEGMTMARLIDEFQFINLGDQIKWDLIGFSFPRGRWGNPNRPKFELVFGRKTNLYICKPKSERWFARWESIAPEGVKSVKYSSRRRWRD